MELMPLMRDDRMTERTVRFEPNERLVALFWRKRVGVEPTGDIMDAARRF
jgi:hypothetical protein